MRPENQCAQAATAQLEVRPVRPAVCALNATRSSPLPDLAGCNLMRCHDAALRAWAQERAAGARAKGLGRPWHLPVLCVWVVVLFVAELQLRLLWRWSRDRLLLLLGTPQ